jgi:hypothetical protein
MGNDLQAMLVDANSILNLNRATLQARFSARAQAGPGL